MTLETFYQEFKDEFKYIKDKVDSIETQTKKTNGRVNRHDVDLSLINERYATHKMAYIQEEMKQIRDEVNYSDKP